MEKAVVYIFKLFAILGLTIFVIAFIQSLWTIKTLHTKFRIGIEKSKDCGYEYMEKETGIYQLYSVLTDASNPLQRKISLSIEMLLLSIALFTVCVLMVAIYFIINRNPNGENIITMWKSPGWIPIIKIGIYLRYILLRVIIAVGLLLYFGTKKQLYIPDYNLKVSNKDEPEEEVAEEEKKEKEEKIKRDVDSTIKRQWLLLGSLALTITVMKRFYVPDIPISDGLIVAVSGAVVMSVLILTTLTRFNAELQEIYKSKYVQQVRSLNRSVSTLLESPVFRDYYVKNAKRMEKYSDEPFQAYQVERLEKEGKLYLYLDHHFSGNHELDFMVNVPREGAGAARNKQATWSPVVQRVRADMNSIRQAQDDINSLFYRYLRRIIAIYALPILAIIYVLFHVSYKNNSLRTVQAIIGIVVILIMIAISSNYLGLLRK